MALSWFVVSVVVSILVYIVWWISSHNPKLNREQLRNKHIVITGASRGIGEQIAYECAKSGANLVITATKESALENVAEKCEKLGCKSVKYIAIDLSKIENCKILVDECVTTLNGKIDYLFLNHVKGHYFEWINKNNINTFDINKKLINANSMISVNVTAYISIATLLYQYLEENAGRIICVSSFAGYSIGVNTTVYGSTKHAISSFFENWRTELNMNGSNITITICILSLVATKRALEAVNNILPDSTINRAANPNNIAKQIISGSQAKLKFVYCPFGDMFVSCCLQYISPSFMTTVFCYLNYKRFW